MLQWTVCFSLCQFFKNLVKTAVFSGWWNLFSVVIQKRRRAVINEGRRDSSADRAGQDAGVPPRPARGTKQDLEVHQPHDASTGKTWRFTALTEAACEILSSLGLVLAAAPT